MKHKILPGFLAVAVVSAMGIAPVRVQAASSIEDVKQNLKSKGIVVAGNVSNLDELKQKLESMGIDCSIPGWLVSLCPELPGNGQPEMPDTPDSEQPETPDSPDNNKPETPDSPDNNQPENPSLPDTDTENADFVRQVVDLVNRERAKAGLSPVTADTSIQAAAQVRAKEIEKSFSHTRPDGSSFSTALTQQGVTYRGSGENIAWGQKTPEQVMNGWMNSEGHRANILNKNFTKIGVGYHQNASGTNYWTQLFTY
ncbi:CAP domain-containing protein [Blautia producta]|uniref:CAP domain-containing protein n=1 Tax=Blautia producta TaxID=33035 RepID=UPI0031B574C3